MKRFFFLSIFFHGALVLSLFCWQVPLADKVFPGRVIEVCLIQSPPVFFEKREAKEPLRKKEVMMPPGSKITEEKEAPPSKQEEEEKAEPAGNEDIFQSRPLVFAAYHEPPALLEEEHPPSSPGGVEDKQWKAPSKATLNFQNGELSASNSLVSTASRMQSGEQKMANPQGDIPEKKGGEGSRAVSRAHTSAIELDPVQQQIIRKIEAAKRYPRAARRMGIEGTAVVRFKLKPQGQVEAVEIAESSGSEILDHASLQTVRDAAPLPYKEGWLKVGIVFKIL